MKLLNQLTKTVLIGCSLLLATVQAADFRLPAYEKVMKASHAFNLLDARHAISVTERQRYILRVRTLAKACAEAYFAAREKLGFPLCSDSKRRNQSKQEA